MRRTRAERGFSIALGLFVIVLAMYLFLASPFFKLEKLYVTGDTDYTESDVLMMSGLQLGQNLFDIDASNLVQRLKENPRIAYAGVKRRLPSGLTIELHMRETVAVLATNSGLWRVDSEGRVLDPVDGPHNNVVITLPTPIQSVAVGQRLDIPALRAAAGVAAALPVELMALVSEIHATPADELELELRDGVKVRFGSWQDSAQKVQVLDLLLKQMQSRGAEAKVIDVSVPGNPVVR